MSNYCKECGGTLNSIFDCPDCDNHINPFSDDYVEKPIPKYCSGEYIILYFDRSGAKLGHGYATTLTQARELAKRKEEAESYAILRTIDNSVERGHKWEKRSRIDIIGQNGNNGEHY